MPEEKRMSVNQRILSYLANRRGTPVTNRQIAVGTRVPLGTVGTQVPKLIDQGLVVRTDTKVREPGKGRWQTTVIAAEFSPSGSEFLVREKTRRVSVDVLGTVDVLLGQAEQDLTLRWSERSDLIKEARRLLAPSLDTPEPA